jgi:xylulokinase
VRRSANRDGPDSRQVSQSWGRHTAAAALGLGATAGDVVVSIGTSGVACAVSAHRVSDPTGTVAGFADATGRFLPLVATLNAAQVLDATARLLGVDHHGLSQLALTAPVGAEGLVLVPYLQGERTPDRPDATGALHGMTLRSTTPAHLARAAVEGLLCGLADALDAVVAQGVPVSRILLTGGAARSEAVRRVAPSLLGCEVVVPAPSEYVADGAARQAAWALSGLSSPPDWPVTTAETLDAAPTPHVRARYADARERTLRQLG